MYSQYYNLGLQTTEEFNFNYLNYLFKAINGGEIVEYDEDSALSKMGIDKKEFEDYIKGYKKLRRWPIK